MPRRLANPSLPSGAQGQNLRHVVEGPAGQPELPQPGSSGDYRENREQCLRPVDRLGRGVLPGDRVESQAMTGVCAPAGKVQPMLTVVSGDGSGHEGGKDHAPSLIDVIVREGARRMLAEALQAEVDAYIAR